MVQSRFEEQGAAADNRWSPNKAAKQPGGGATARGRGRAGHVGVRNMGGRGRVGRGQPGKKHGKHRSDRQIFFNPQDAALRDAIAEHQRTHRLTSQSIGAPARIHILVGRMARS